jgi:eukaryotic-like serine/threonine-protein kinase
MSDAPLCPECGCELSPHAPSGLCPRCLLNAAVAASASGPVPVDPINDDPRGTSAPAQERPTPGPRGSLSLDAFKRQVVELGILDANAIDRHAVGSDARPAELARSLIRSGVMTAYQASAIQQGKSRGLLIGRYLILDKLGEGGMGVVFKAKHRLLDRVVALKILPPSFARQRSLVDRFRREMQTTARLNHPNVVSVLDADQDRGVYYLAMDYIEGRDLDHVVRERGPLAVEQAIDCAIQAARGLEAAHAQGIVHRDIKPGNLILDAMGVVRVLDLGLARLVNGSSTSAEAAPTNLTRSGVFMGTVDFMAPEQAEDSRNVDHRADIYSLGCSLYYLLTGRPPFEGRSLIMRIMAHQQQPPPSIRALRNDVVEPLDTAYQEMMAKNPDDRPRTMTDVIGLLNSCRSAGSSADVGFSLSSISIGFQATAPTTLIESGPLDTAGDRPQELQFATSPRPEHRDLVARPELLIPSVKPASPSGQTLTVVPRKRAWREPSGLAMLVSGFVLAALIFFFSVQNRRNGEFQASSATNRATTRAASGAHPDDRSKDLAATKVTTPTALDARSALRPQRRADAEKSPAPGSASASEAAANVLPGKSTEPSPIPPKLDLSGRADVAVPAVPRPTVAAVPTYQAATAFDLHTKAVRAIAVTRDGRRALTAGLDNTARFWEVNTGREIHPPFLQSSDILDVSITPDGRFALTATKGASSHGALWLLNLVTGKIVRRGMGAYHAGAVRAVACLRNDLALSAGEDGQVILWDIEHRGQVRNLGSREGLVWHAMAVSRDGRQALTGGKDGLVHHWNLATGLETTKRWGGHQGPISDIAISADSRRAVTSSNDHTVILWDVGKGTAVNQFIMPDHDQTPSVAILPDGNILAAGGGSGRLVLWDALTGAILREARPPFVAHNDLAVLPDGRVLTADQDAVVRMWTPCEP